jgi:ABC-2 type transport system permease protein
MSSVRATALVAGRELREAFRRRSLWVVFAILFVGSTAAMVLPDVVESSTTRYRVAVVSSGAPTQQDFEAALRPYASALDARLSFIVAKSAGEARRLVDSGDADVAVVTGSQPRVIVRSGEQQTLVAVVRQALATERLRENLGAARLSPSQIDAVLRVPAPTVVGISADHSERQTAAAALSFALYVVLLLLMIQAANGVAIEKANRISEVLLAVVRPGALLFGKVIGVGIVGLAGLAAGAIPVIVKATAGGNLPPGLGPALAGGFPWMVLGLVLYLTIAGSLGALVERQEEAGSVLTPLSLLLIATYVLAQSAAGGSFGAVLAIFPLTSPIVMPVRIALGDASATEVVASLVVGVATVVVVVRLGAAIYRRGIVHTGRRLRLGEALRSP